jgi:hypothetical protein
MRKTLGPLLVCSLNGVGLLMSQAVMTRGMKSSRRHPQQRERPGALSSASNLLRQSSPSLPLWPEDAGDQAR